MHDFLLDQMEHHAFPALAAALRSRHEQIMSKWEGKVKQALPAADRLTWAGLRDDLPRALEEMARSLAAASTSHVTDMLNKGAEHGTCRYHQSYNLNELIIEYALLRPIVISEVHEDLQRDLKPIEVNVLEAAMDHLLRMGVLAFTDHQTRQLKIAAEAESKYLSFLSHDLRGGLNGILLMIEVLRNELSTEPRLNNSIEDLEMMRRSIHETVGTMERFLQAERLHKGKVQPKLADIDLKAIVQDICSQFTLTAQNKRLDFQVELCDCRLVTDRELVMLVLQNLLGNAIKYTRQGKVIVRLEKPAAPNSADPSAPAAVVAIIDEGPGMDETQLQTLFAPFARGDTHGESGVGLGLAIACQAAELAGLTFRVHSQPGKGTAFHVEFPRRPAAAGAAPSSIPA